MFRAVRKVAKVLIKGIIGSEKTRRYRIRLLQFTSYQQQRWLLRRRGRALFNFWEHRRWEDFWLWRFLNRPRLRAALADRTVAFISVFGPVEVAQRVRADVKVFFTGENLDFYPAYRNHLRETVDFALGFDDLEASGYMRFPLWLLSCFPPDLDPEGVAARLRQFTANRRDLLERPNMVASLVASHDTSGIRGAIADLFGEIGEVHYGGRFRNSGSTVPPGGDFKHQFIRQFPFQICPENSARDGYVTEKLFQAIAAGCVPIYWGANQPPEPDILNQDAILFYEPDQPDKLAEALRSLRDDPDKLRQFRDMPPFQPDAADRIFAYYSDLEKLFLRACNEGAPGRRKNEAR